MNAFNIKEDRLEYFKGYCKSYGTFFHPVKDSDIQNKHMYNEVLNSFKNSISFKVISVDAVPYCRISQDKQGMNEMVSRPGYINSESDKNLSVFLNGDTQKRFIHKDRRQTIKSKCCFKAVQVRNKYDFSNFENEF